MIKNLFLLLFLNISISLKNIVEFFRVAINYYTNFKFRKLDLYLLAWSFFRSPFRISKQYWKGRGAKNIYVYGETPLTTLDQIFQQCALNEGAVVYELGCGRGRTCFWLNMCRKCDVTGIEIIPEFVDKAKRIARKFDCKGVVFRCEDMLTADLTQAEVIYLYGSNFSDSFIVKLIENLKCLKVGTKIITVSYPLTDYTEEPLFEVVNTFTSQFPWGEAQVYLQRKT